METDNMKFMAAVVALVLAGSTATANAQEPWPSKPIRLVVGYTAGGASDIVGRLIAMQLTALNGQPVVVENRPGVGGILGMDNVARSAPDGYTIGVAVSGSLVTGPHLTKSMPYDPLTSFEPVSMVALAPMILVATPDARFANVTELIAQARQSPDVLMYATGAQAFDLAMRLFNAKADTRIGAVQYPGGAQAAIDVMSGRVPLMVDTIGAQQSNIRSGKLKAVAVLDSKRSSVFPDVPTIAESGVPGYQAVGWLGIVVPKGTPAPIVARLNEQVAKIMKMPEVRDKLVTLGFEPFTDSPKEFDALIHKEYAQWGKVVKDSGMTPE
jgi:tripartite-type tricarboxylate transporter receptor subunit TctC